MITRHTSNNTIIAMVSIMFSHRASSLHQYPNPIPLAKQQCLDAATNGSNEPGHASIQHRLCFLPASKSTLQEHHFELFDTMKGDGAPWHRLSPFPRSLCRSSRRHIASPLDIIVAEPPSLLYFRYQQREMNISAAITRDEIFRHLLPPIVPWNVTCSVQSE
jgi:hypothetical protein